MVKVTLDTNVLISGTFWEGEAYKIIKLIEQNKIQCILSKEILAEYSKVIHSNEILEKTEESHQGANSAIIKIECIPSVYDRWLRRNDRWDT